MARDRYLWGDKWSELSGIQKFVRVVIYAFILYLFGTLFWGLFIPA